MLIYEGTKDNFRIGNYGTGDSHTLLLTTG